MTILALETSCDDTCAAVLDDGGRALSNVISSQTDHERFGGVVPEIASRHHLELVNAIVAQALEDAGASSAIASSGGKWTPVVGVWSVALSDSLAEALRQGVRAVHRFATAQGSAVVEFPSVEIGGEPIDPFFNVNTQVDLEKARALLAAESARG